jgi:hypothetical protein
MTKKKQVIKECCCKYCGHKWFPSKPGRPAVCPNDKCHTPRWDQKRVLPPRAKVEKVNIEEDL